MRTDRMAWLRTSVGACAVCLLLLSVAVSHAEPTSDETRNQARAEKLRELNQQATTFLAEARRLEGKADEPGGKLRHGNQRLAMAYSRAASYTYAEIDAIRRNDEAAYREAKQKFDYWHDEMTFLAEGREPMHPQKSGNGGGSTTGDGWAPAVASTLLPLGGYNPGAAPLGSGAPGALPTPAAAPGPSDMPPSVSPMASGTDDAKQPSDPAFTALLQQASELKRRLADGDGEPK